MNLDPVIAIDRALRAWAGCFSPRRRTSCSDMVDFRVGARDVSRCCPSDWSRCGVAGRRRRRGRDRRRACCGNSRPRIVGGAALLLAYAAVMAINLVRGRRFIDCGCGGAAQPLSLGLVLRNVVLAHRRGHRAGAERRRGRSAGSTSSAWSRRVRCSARCMRRRINCSRRARGSRSGCDGQR